MTASESHSHGITTTPGEPAFSPITIFDPTREGRSTKRQLPTTTNHPTNTTTTSTRPPPLTRWPPAAAAVKDLEEHSAASTRRRTASTCMCMGVSNAHDDTCARYAYRTELTWGEPPRFPACLGRRTGPPVEDLENRVIRSSQTTKEARAWNAARANRSAIYCAPREKGRDGHALRLLGAIGDGELWSESGS
jgi:hypothetical protein